jgi:hypothetical protein
MALTSVRASEPHSIQPAGESNAIERVFEQGSFAGTIPLRTWIEATYGPGTPMKRGQFDSLGYKFQGHQAWVLFGLDEAQDAAYSGVTEYLVTTIRPSRKTLARLTWEGAGLPRLSGVTLGAAWSQTSTVKFKKAGADLMFGRPVSVYETWPFGVDEGTLHRIFVAKGRVVGLSVSIPE